MKTSLQIHIPKPCSQSWDTMTPAAGGRFCSSCRKTVVDFSMMSHREILDYLQTTSGSSCGYFHASQLNTPLTPVQPAKRRYVVSGLLASLLALVLPAAGKAQPPTLPVAVHDNQEKLPAPAGDTIAEPVISGIVKDHQTGEPVPAAQITIKGASTAVHTDAKGYYRLQVPDKIQQQPVVLVVSFIGYEQQEITISPVWPANRDIYLSLHVTGNFETVIFCKTPVKRKFLFWWRKKS
ncbi:carboxypeptidase-like regulatory domain-containing protein [Chitinophaga sp. Mgbs1]|uniref:Carboxypeptidase-like regulatory domain-containing protein n=1 Tax=Chitinophaga solisilvae TaxID=1233460 RepID=A0A9Q5CWG1_9BACT|nr:carboxypeptidase-like regulatory domain-containing protein [Chitinophaga solisilvae]